MVRVQIIYLQQLTLSYNLFYELHMSGTITPTSANNFSRESLNDEIHHKTAKSDGPYNWSFKISLDSSKKVNFFDSKTHKLELLSENDTRTELMLSMASQCIPNKDFTFTYTTQDYHLPSYVLGRTDVSSTAMISFIPKFCDMSVDDAYKASISGAPYEVEIQYAKGQYIFLLDRSGSMKGRRIEKAKQPLILFIKSLLQDAYFNLISFGTGYIPLFSKSIEYTNQSIKKATQEIKRMNADMSGTQIYSPLEKYLSQKNIQGYPRLVFLLTDGAVSNTQHIFELIETNNKYSRVHTIGIGNGASQELIIGCAKHGKGYYTLISDQQNPSSQIIKLLTNSLSPVISKMKLTYDKM